MQNEAKSKRGRTSNWNVTERRVFMELSVRQVLNDKSCNANNNTLKKQAWANLLSSFNTMSDTKRTLPQLQVQFKTMKVATRKRLDLACTTGGGPPAPPPTDEDLKLYEMLPQEFVVKRNELDSDGLFEVVPASNNRYA